MKLEKNNKNDLSQKNTNICSGQISSHSTDIEPQSIVIVKYR